MKAEYVLEMLDDGNTEVLRQMCEEEIHKNSLTGNRRSSGKTRYAAMKRFYKPLSEFADDACKAPLTGVTWGDDTMNCFMDGYCFVVTREGIGEIVPYEGKGMDFEKFHASDYEFDNAPQLPVSSIVAKAKSLGYKLNKDECRKGNCRYVIRMKGYDWKIQQIDRCFAIINDGDDPYMVIRDRRLYFATEIGTAMVLPCPVFNDDPKRVVVVTDEDTTPYHADGWRRVSEADAFDLYRGGEDGTEPNYDVAITADRLNPDNWGQRWNTHYELCQRYDREDFNEHKNKAKRFLGRDNGYYLAYYVNEYSVCEGGSQ